MAVDVNTDSSFVPDTPYILFEGDYLAPNTNRHVYDVSLDDQRFLMIKNARSGETSGESPAVVVVENWTEELKRLVPTR